MKIIEWFAGIFSDEGNVSSMRISMFVCVAAACYMAIIAVQAGTVTPDTTKLIGSFLVAGMGGKIWQKYFETKGS